MPRQIATAVVLLGILVAACGGLSAGEGALTAAGGLSPFTFGPGAGGDGAGEGPGDPGGASGGHARLEPFSSCGALLDYFHREALARVGPYGLSGGVIGDPRLLVVDAAENALPVRVPAGEGGDTGYSGTNVQVAGVDEPDIVETDGRRILIAMNGTLYYLGVEGADARLLGSLPLGEGWDHRFFALGSRALVFSRGDGFAPPPEGSSFALLPVNGVVTLVQEVDLSDPARLRVVRALRVEGGYVSARAVGPTVRLVISSYPADLPFVYPSSPGAEELALEANRRVVEQSELRDWLPSFSLSADDRVLEQGLLVGCDRVHRPGEFAGFSTLSVLTFDLEEPLGAGEGTAVVADGETVYSSAEHLYVATNTWLPDGPAGEALVEGPAEYSTAIHAFDIGGDRPARYLASGSVAGHLLNQFAMDEHEGYLRVATTEGMPWGGSTEAESAVTVLALGAGRLEAVGRVGDLGRGESIYSVRFLGPVGYVVTFRQTDPLYVIDLRDPGDPRLSGELEIPGYSAYLHPLGEGRLLGVGRAATGEGSVTGAKVTLFDVSDPGAPRALDSWTLPDGYSDVEFDHLAFLYWAPAGLVVLPMQDWTTGFAGAVVLAAGDELREVGRVVHGSLEGTGLSGCVPIDPEETKGLTVQVCGPDDPGGRGGHYCEVVPADGAADVLAGYGLAAVDLASEERLEVCWPDPYPAVAPITRSLVIGETLWTLSWQRLQGNDLAGLAVVDAVPLG